MAIVYVTNPGGFLIMAHEPEVVTKQEIVVTDEMIEAGVDYLREITLGTIDLSDSARDVFLAMLVAKGKSETH